MLFEVILIQRPNFAPNRLIFLPNSLLWVFLLFLHLSHLSFFLFSVCQCLGMAILSPNLCPVECITWLDLCHSSHWMLMYGEARERAKGRDHQSADGMERKENVFLTKTANQANTDTLQSTREDDETQQSGDALPTSLPCLCFSAATAVAALSLYNSSSNGQQINKCESTVSVGQHSPNTLSRRLIFLTRSHKDESSVVASPVTPFFLQERSTCSTYLISNRDLIFIIGASSSAFLRLLFSTHLNAIVADFNLEKALLRWRWSRERQRCNHIARRMPSLLDSISPEREEKKKPLSSTHPLTFTFYGSIGASSAPSSSSSLSSLSSSSSSPSSPSSSSRLLTPYSVQSALPFFLPIFPLFHVYSILPFLLLFFTVTVLLPATSSALPPSINVGAVFTKDRIDHEIAFRLAIKRINVDRVILPHTQLVPKIEHIQAHDSFHGNKKGQFFKVSSLFVDLISLCISWQKSDIISLISHLKLSLPLY